MIKVNKTELERRIKEGKAFKVILTPNTSKLLQELLFSLGGIWVTGDIERN
jgi:hypothetical protein